MKGQQTDPMKLVATIAERGKANSIMRLYTKEQVFLHFQCPGKGTATSEIMEILGLGSDQKDVILSLATSTAADRLLFRLNDELRSALDTRGIVFSIKLRAASSLAAAVLNAQTLIKAQNGGNQMEQTPNTLILAMTNQGYSDQLMNVAKGAGARGGTVIRGRLSGFEDLETAYGLELDSEREILAIVVSGEQLSPIMEALNKAHGLRSKANTILCALPIDHLVRFG